MFFYKAIVLLFLFISQLLISEELIMNPFNFENTNIETLMASKNSCSRCNDKVFRPIKNSNIKIEVPKLTSSIYSMPLKLWTNYLTKIDNSTCPMYPTCSHFFKLAIAKHNFYLALTYTLARMLKETPDMAKFEEYELILKFGTYRFYDPLENYNLNED
ncbi:MAG: membrane protein insertion efficiency factor YidD [Pseudomonadota bacterium]